jgi:hypothetical protein
MGGGIRSLHYIALCRAAMIDPMKLMPTQGGVLLLMPGADVRQWVRTIIERTHG